MLVCALEKGPKLCDFPSHGQRKAVEVTKIRAEPREILRLGAGKNPCCRHLYISTRKSRHRQGHFWRSIRGQLEVMDGGQRPRANRPNKELQCPDLKKALCN